MGQARHPLAWCCLGAERLAPEEAVPGALHAAKAPSSLESHLETKVRGKLLCDVPRHQAAASLPDDAPSTPGATLLPSSQRALRAYTARSSRLQLQDIHMQLVCNSKTAFFVRDTAMTGSNALLGAYAKQQSGDRHTISSVQCIDLACSAAGAPSPPNTPSRLTISSRPREGRPRAPRASKRHTCSEGGSPAVTHRRPPAAAALSSNLRLQSLSAYTELAPMSRRASGLLLTNLSGQGSMPYTVTSRAASAGRSSSSLQRPNGVISAVQALAYRVEGQAGGGGQVSPTVRRWSAMVNKIATDQGACQQRQRSQDAPAP